MDPAQCGRKLPNWLLGCSSALNREAKSTRAVVASSKSEEASLPVLSFPGKVVYCHVSDECNFHCEEMLELAKCSPLTVGFDIEWKVAYSKGTCTSTAVLQLCPSEKRCYVFHLAVMGAFPVMLRCVLEDSRIIKVGAGISGDFAKLSLETSVIPASVVDLSCLANDRLHTNDQWSLNGLLMNRHQKRLIKDSRLRCSNWERYPLSEEQLVYAALDAYASLIVYHSLSSM